MCAGMHMQTVRPGAGRLDSPRDGVTAGCIRAQGSFFFCSEQTETCFYFFVLSCRETATELSTTTVVRHATSALQPGTLQHPLASSPLSFDNPAAIRTSVSVMIFL